MLLSMAVKQNAVLLEERKNALSKTRVFLWWVALLGFVWATPVLAGSAVRYALVVGNNYAQTPPGVVLPDLLHAEDEARRLKDSLVKYANFDDDPGRLVMLVGKTRKQILEAASLIAKRHKEDRKRLGELQTLFMFFFTGHGLEGKLLTAGEPLTGHDLQQIFTEVGATFTIGVFDACFSGTLDLSHIRNKGIRPTPGFNVFEQLPREILNASGTMWFTSSQPDQVSYEDIKLGGVFTHFFMEGMKYGRSDELGITLDAVWDYTLQKTIRYTSRSGRPQTPQKIVRSMVSSGPMYFSFPNDRSAVLAFAEDVEGQFLLRYETGGLFEQVDKKAGVIEQAKVFHGDVVIERVDTNPRQRQQVSIAKGGKIWIKNEKNWSTLHQPGFGEVTLQPKGGQLEGLMLSERISSFTGMLGLGYQVYFGDGFSAQSLHNSNVFIRLDWGNWAGSFGLMYGRESESFTAWQYTLERLEIGLQAGPAFDWGPIRIWAAARIQPLWRQVSYQDASIISEWGFAAGGLVDVLIPLVSDPFPLLLFVRSGIQAEWSAPVAPPGAPLDMQLVPWVGMAIGTEVF
jgi:hypothetical protein